LNEGLASVTDSTLSQNQALGGAGLYGGVGRGGGIDNEFAGSSLTVMRTLLLDNEAIGGPRSAVGAPISVFDSEGDGGAIGNLSGAIVTITNSTLTGNEAIGGAGAVAGAEGGNGSGGAILNLLSGSAVTITYSAISGNEALGGAGRAGAQDGDVVGGAILSQFKVSLTIDHCSLTGNRAITLVSTASDPDKAEAQGGAIMSFFYCQTHFDE
jgi:hypothetical protein